MTRANRLIGLSVIREGDRLGVVDGVNVSPCGKRLSGLFLQTGKLRAGYLPAESIRLVGENAVLADGAMGKRVKPFTLRRVRDTSGMKLGMVTDALVEERTLYVEAVELSFGPIDDLLRGRRWVDAFSVDPDSGDVIVPCDVWQRITSGSGQRNGNP